MSRQDTTGNTGSSLHQKKKKTPLCWLIFYCMYPSSCLPHLHPGTPSGKAARQLNWHCLSDRLWYWMLTCSRPPSSFLHTPPPPPHFPRELHSSSPTATLLLSTPSSLSSLSSFSESPKPSLSKNTDPLSQERRAALRQDGKKLKGCKERMERGGVTEVRAASGVKEKP